MLLAPPAAAAACLPACLPACLLQAVVREKSTTDSKKLGVLVEGQRVRVVSSRQRDGVERCKVALPPGIKGERGWVSLVRILSLSVSLSAHLRTCAAASLLAACGDVSLWKLLPRLLLLPLPLLPLLPNQHPTSLTLSTLGLVCCRRARRRHGTAPC
jgi:hypothetical protein